MQHSLHSALGAYHSDVLYGRSRKTPSTVAKGFDVTNTMPLADDRQSMNNKKKRWREERQAPQLSGGPHGGIQNERCSERRLENQLGVMNCLASSGARLALLKRSRSAGDM